MNYRLLHIYATINGSLPLSSFLSIVVAVALGSDLRYSAGLGQMASAYTSDAALSPWRRSDIDAIVFRALTRGTPDDVVILGAILEEHVLIAVYRILDLFYKPIFFPIYRNHTPLNSLYMEKPKLQNHPHLHKPRFLTFRYCDDQVYHSNTALHYV